MTERDTESTAREKARLIAKKSSKGNRSTVAFKVGIAAVALLIMMFVGIIALNVITQSGGKKDLSTVTRPSIVKDEGITIGHNFLPVYEPSKVNVVIYQDYLCPGCGAFEASYKPEIEKILDERLATVEYRNLGMLDKSPKSNYSSRTAGAALCVAENDGAAFHEFNSLLFANQPSDSSGLDDDAIKTLAKSAGAKRSDTCISEGTYREFVKQLTHKVLSNGEIAGTPTVLINGEPFSREGSLYDAVKAAKSAE